jgi:hypothetical protein
MYNNKCKLKCLHGENEMLNEVAGKHIVEVKNDKGEVMFEFYQKNHYGTNENVSNEVILQTPFFKRPAKCQFRVYNKWTGLKVYSFYYGSKSRNINQIWPTEDECIFIWNNLDKFDFNKNHKEAIKKLILDTVDLLISSWTKHNHRLDDVQKLKDIYKK